MPSSSPPPGPAAAAERAAPSPRTGGRPCTRRLTGLHPHPTAPPRALGQRWWDALGPLHTLLGRLTPWLAERDERVVQQLTAALIQRPLRVVVHGPTRSGRSTLLNALLGEPGLLPSEPPSPRAHDIRLHVGRVGLPDAGARLALVDESGWRALHGAAAPVPRDSRALLGRVLELDGVSPTELLRQLRTDASTLGQDSAHGPRPSATVQRFGRMTRQVELYRPASPQQAAHPRVPVTLTERVGATADGRALPRADVHVVVLPVRRLLDATDHALERWMAGLDPARTVLFVNKLDAFAGEGLATMQERAEEAAHGLAERAWGHRRPQLVLGSGRWAESAAALERGHTVPESGEPVLQLMVADGLVAHPPLATPERRARVASTLRAWSGLDALTETIDRLFLGQEGWRLRRAAAAHLRKVADTAAAQAAAEREAARTSREVLACRLADLRRLAETLDGEARALATLRGVLEGLRRQLLGELDRRVDVGLAQLRLRLEDQVDALSRGELARVFEDASQGRSESAGGHEVQPGALRDACDLAVKAACDALAAATLPRQRRTVAALRASAATLRATAATLGHRHTARWEKVEAELEARSLGPSELSSRLGAQLDRGVDAMPVAQGARAALDEVWTWWFGAGDARCRQADALDGRLRRALAPVIDQRVADARPPLEAVARRLLRELDETVERTIGEAVAAHERHRASLGEALAQVSEAEQQAALAALAVHAEEAGQRLSALEEVATALDRLVREELS